MRRNADVYFSQHFAMVAFYSNCIQSRPWWHCVYINPGERRYIYVVYAWVYAIQYAWWWRYDDLHLSNRKRIWITFTLTDGGHAHERFRVSSFFFTSVIFYFFAIRILANTHSNSLSLSISLSFQSILRAFCCCLFYIKKKTESEIKRAVFSRRTKQKFHLKTKKKHMPKEEKKSQQDK